MTSNSDSIDISLSGVYKSWYAFRAGKRPSRLIITFEYQLENNLYKLANDIQNNHYQHGSYRHILVQDSKPRRIVVAEVRDRVVHRMLYDHFVPLMDSHFDHDVWSCRKGKGLEEAINRTRSLLVKYPHGWVWRGDVAKFFDSVNHEVLREIVRRYVKDEAALDLLQRVTTSYFTEAGRGIPIGNLTSQILSNAYLNEFDRFVRHTLKPLGYVRYGDDFILIFPDEQQTLKAQELGSAFLAESLKLTMHATNNIVVPVRRGLHFLGLNLFPQGRSIQDKTWKRVKRRLADNNRSSYFGLVQNMGNKKQKKEFKWLEM